MFKFTVKHGGYDEDSTIYTAISALLLLEIDFFDRPLIELACKWAAGGEIPCK